MDPKEILRKIISSNGSCDWIDLESADKICEACPLSHAQVGETGNFMSCTEMIDTYQQTSTAANARYKSIAIDILNRIELEEAIFDDEQDEGDH